jgi:tetratricopeptide (TPR) repeat protein
MVKMHRLAIVGLGLMFGAMGIMGVPVQLFAQEPGNAWVSKVVSIQGRVTAKRLGQAIWQPVKLNDTLYPGDRIRVEANSRAGIRLSNDAVLRLDQNTTLVFTQVEKETTFIFKLLKGAANFFSRRPRSLKILTPFVNGVVEGTEFYVRVDEGQTRIDLFEGRIRAQNPYGELQLAKGQSAVAASGSAPRRRILIKPRQSVQWALYYPPVLALGPDEVPLEIQDALISFHQGRPLEAVDSLEQTANDARNTTFFSVRAALLLHLGRISQARDDLGTAVAMDPDNAEAWALKAMIAVVQNRKEDALQIAGTAVRKKPASAAAQLALSYALQAAFNLPESLAAAEAAVQHAPENATAWARLAELRLSMGALDMGMKAAQKATRLNPHAAHAHTILGFAYLTQIKTAEAVDAFSKAIALDSAAPLPRLGLGLAIIRNGELDGGRAQIEIAAGLDPVNAMIRSYLGKAYFDEKRQPLDGQQLEIAKRLDPNDPTPWYYSAIGKQALNRPVEALQDLRKSMALNDNRAVYRSRFLLDKDFASRSASLSRIYSDLDFQELALRQGYRSLNADPANYSAHRLLADTYASRPRHDISRVSELLQAQLLQSINITPTQPQLADTNLFILNNAGPADASFGEFNPLFIRNRINARLSTVAGRKDTIGDEVVLSAVQRNVSLSLGQFYYETDGFRENNDLKHEIYNAFIQVGLTPNTSIQSEIRYRDTERGDPYLRFEPDNFSPTVRRPQEIRSGRFGFHHKQAPTSDVIGSLIYTDANSQYIEDLFKLETIDYGYVAELQHLMGRKMFNLTTGVGYLDGDREFKTIVPSRSINRVQKYELEHIFGYLYTNIRWPFNAAWTLGASASDFSGLADKTQLNPKIGVSWHIAGGTTIRAAAFRVLEDTLIAKQRLEPTHVAGFTQVFEEVLDGGEAVDAWNYGVGIDRDLTDTLSCGIEYVKRELDVPVLQLSSGTTYGVKWDEEAVRLYLYESPLDWLTLHLGYHFESYRRENKYTGDEDITELDTHRFPIGVRFFLPAGFFAGVKATYVAQEGKFGSRPTATKPLLSGEDAFWVFDADMGYRLPRRLGIISVDGKNIFNNGFKFQDTDPSRPSIFPDQQILVKLTLSF